MPLTNTKMKKVKKTMAKYEINEEKLTRLAIDACPNDLQPWSPDDYCMLLDDAVYYGLYNGSVVDCCRACWLKWFSKESEDKHE